MKDLQKKRARQFRYLKKKKAQGLRYIQLWIAVKESNVNRLKVALAHSSSSDIEKFINNYFEKPLTHMKLLEESMQIKNINQFSSDLCIIKRVICLLLANNPSASPHKMSQTLFDQYKLCSFTKKTKEPCPIDPNVISAITYECRHLINV